MHAIAAHAEGPAAIKDALKDFFWTRKPPEKEVKEEEKDDKEKIEIPKSDKEGFELAQIAGGFSVKRKGGGDMPMNAQINVAYDRRRGKPKWSKEDFDFTTDAITIEAQGDGAFSADPSSLTIQNAKPGYQLKATGFLPSRDLFVSVDVENEAADAV